MFRSSFINYNDFTSFLANIITSRKITPKIQWTQHFHIRSAGIAHLRPSRTEVARV